MVKFFLTWQETIMNLNFFRPGKNWRFNIIKYYDCWYTYWKESVKGIRDLIKYPNKIHKISGIWQIFTIWKSRMDVRIQYFQQYRSVFNNTNDKTKSERPKANEQKKKPSFWKYSKFDVERFPRKVLKMNCWDFLIMMR